MHSEKRAYRRVPVSLDVLWNGMLIDNYGRATDISMGGCYVETAGMAGVGELITVDMMLTRQTHLHLRCEVAHREWPIGYGLRFVNLIGEARASVVLLVDAPRVLST